MGFIEYNYKHTLRVKKLESLYGMAIYHNIIVNTPNVQLAENCIKRLVEFYLRPSPSTKLSLISSSSS